MAFKNTIDDVRIIGISSLKKLFTWVHDAYAVHDNMISQTGGLMSMGCGMVHFRSTK